MAEAIRHAEAGEQIKPTRNKTLTIPPQLQEALKKNKQTHTTFDAMTKGTQREYADYIADAKREETKAKRIAKIIPMIVNDVGLNDKYR